MFNASPLHLGLAVAGIAVVLAHWLPRWISGREPAASALLLLAGAAAGFAVPELTAAVDPLRHGKMWEIVTEVAVVLSLFGTGLRIDRAGFGSRWRPTVLLLAVGMPLTIAGVAMLGWQIAGFGLATALLLGAVLSPTDPVLAGDVQVGPPLEGDEHPVRFTLTAEAGLNDGLAFPFVLLALLVAADGWTSGGLLEWAGRDVLYRIVAGVAGGGAIGWLLGRLMFVWPAGNVLASTDTGVVAIAGAMVAYGATELIEGYGFIAAFVAGIVLRQSEARHDYHRTLHDFSAAIEHALLALALVALGAALPALWAVLDWGLVAVGVLLVFAVRPLACWLALLGTGLRHRERLVVAFYGVRGFGTLYYLAYALDKTPLYDGDRLWAAVGFVIALSTLVHGLTAGFAIERVAADPLPVEPRGPSGA